MGLGISPDLDTKIFKVVIKQLTSDTKNMESGKPVSLLAKWMPSINTSSESTKKLARMFAQNLRISEKQYRKMLSGLRSYLVVTEKQMSEQKWNEIDYKSVPSKANLLYKDAFMRHDEWRRKDYLESLKKGETKINASTLFPHDVVHKYSASWWTLSPVDETVEQLWKNLPDYVQGNGNTMVVADGSGSMMSGVGGSNVTAWEVAHALAIYFAERSSGPFKDQYITFSSTPQFVNLKQGSLNMKLGIARKHSEISNTNIEAVFDLILNTAIRTHAKQSDIPANILIISDMEFDSATYGGYYGRFATPSQTLFDTIRQKYERAGYKLPRLVFWNVNSRTGSIPVTENELGVALVSGFSPAICKIVLSGNLDPYGALVETLMNKRYDPVEEAIKNTL